MIIILLLIVIALAALFEYCSRPCDKDCDYPHCYHCTPITDDDDELWPKYRK